MRARGKTPPSHSSSARAPLAAAMRAPAAGRSSFIKSSCNPNGVRFDVIFGKRPGIDGHSCLKSSFTSLGAGFTCAMYSDYAYKNARVWIPVARPRLVQGLWRPPPRAPKNAARKAKVMTEGEDGVFEQEGCTAARQRWRLSNRQAAKTQ